MDQKQKRYTKNKKSKRFFKKYQRLQKNKNHKEKKKLGLASNIVNGKLKRIKKIQLFF